MTDVHFTTLNAAASMLYNYNVIPHPVAYATPRGPTALLHSSFNFKVARW